MMDQPPPPPKPRCCYTGETIDSDIYPSLNTAGAGFPLLPLVVAQAVILLLVVVVAVAGL